MKIIIRNKWLVVVFIAMMFVLFNIAWAAQDSDSVIITQPVANCNNNGVCDSFENINVCPNDCSSSTTPSVPLGDGSGFVERVETKFDITDIQIEAGVDKVDIKVFVNKLASVDLEWGKSMGYGNVQVSRDLKFVHEFHIDNLESDTPYYYKVKAESMDGRGAEYKGAFKTKTVKEEIIVLNVTDFKAFPEEDYIKLVWNNPQEGNFEGVRIVRSEKFFPTDPYAGKVVFEGKGEEYIDKDVKKGIVYYYTAFSFDDKNNFSSGVVTQAIIPQKEEEVIEEDGKEIIESPTLYPPIDILDVIEESPIKSVEIDRLSLDDFDILQRDHMIEPIKGMMVLDASKPFKISISYDKVPEVLKSIIVRIYKNKGKNEKISFLLRVDDKKTEYKAIVAPLEEVGVYNMEVYILDFKHRKLKVLNGSLIGVRQAGVKAGIYEEIDDKKYDFKDIGIYTSVLFMILVLILIFYRVIKRELIV